MLKGVICVLERFLDLLAPTNTTHMRFIILLLAAMGVATTQYAQAPVTLSVDSFLSQPFGPEETLDRLVLLGGLKFKAIKELVPNLHNPAVTDTIYHLKKGKNLISIYKGQHNMFVYHAVLRSRKIKLAAGVHPKMPRAAFYQKIRGLEDTGSNFHTFYNSEKSAIAQVVFCEGRVKQLEIEYIVD